VSRRGREIIGCIRHNRGQMNGTVPCEGMEYGVFSCIMNSPRVVTFRIAPEKVAQLDTLAKAMDRDRSYLLNEAVEAYLGDQRRFIAMVEEGREDMRHGRFKSHEEVERMVNEWSREDQSKAK
jgi:predicted transcriptional regulator